MSLQCVQTKKGNEQINQKLFPWGYEREDYLETFVSD